MFKKVLLAAIATGLTLGAISTANAADGCGRGFHRGPYGHCRPNGPGPAIVAPGIAIGPAGLTIGVFYPGHGYWDGHRYWQHRERWHDGWRYR
jgi:hypothetical protein